VSMINSGRFQIEANISETEIAKVDLGDKVEMTLDALGPAEKFVGEIIKIDPAETIISGVIYYKITSVFDVEDGRIKSGMTVNLDIQTDKKENVLYLPYYVVKGINGDKFVNLLKDGEVVELIIKTGLEGENRIEIVEGLEEGEEVVMEAR
ncbi:efflux RND transporter periplasmic adaptor subunit, partial [Patescibacteria group bacterium]|nr:efflux RND transporter periplasmic adaptor subunit [Patescibacteria group bacterium]